jgi:hypothetical protein
MLQVYIKNLPSFVKRHKKKVALGSIGFLFMNLTMLRRSKKPIKNASIKTSPKTG